MDIKETKQPSHLARANLELILSDRHDSIVETESSMQNHTAVPIAAGVFNLCFLKK